MSKHRAKPKAEVEPAGEPDVELGPESGTDLDTCTGGIPKPAPAADPPPPPPNRPPGPPNP